MLKNTQAIVKRLIESELLVKKLAFPVSDTANGNVATVKLVCAGSRYGFEVVISRGPSAFMFPAAWGKADTPDVAAIPSPWPPRSRRKCGANLAVTVARLCRQGCPWRRFKDSENHHRVWPT